MTPLLVHYAVTLLLHDTTTRALRGCLLLHDTTTRALCGCAPAS